MEFLLLFAWKHDPILDVGLVLLCLFWFGSVRFGSVLVEVIKAQDKHKSLK